MSEDGHAAFLNTVVSAAAERQIALLAAFQNRIAKVDMSEVESVLGVLERIVGDKGRDDSGLGGAVKGQALCTMAAVHIILDLPHKRQNLFSEFMNVLFSYLIMSCNEENVRIRHDAALSLYEIELAFPGILILQASLVTELASRETIPSAAAAYTVLASAIIPSGVKLSTNAPSRRARQNSKSSTGTAIPMKVYYTVPASYLSYPLQFKVPKDGERQEISDLKSSMLQLCSLTSRLPLAAQVAVVATLMMVSRPLVIEREAVHVAISKVCRGLTSGKSSTPADALAVALAVTLRSSGGLPELLSDRGATLLIQLGLHDPTLPVWKQWLYFKWRKDLCYHLAARQVPMSSPLRMGGAAAYYDPMVLSEALQAGPAALMELTHLAEVLGPMILAVKRHQARSRYTKLVFVDVWCKWLMAAGYCGGKEMVLQMLVNMLLAYPDDFGLQVVEMYEELKRLSLLQEAQCDKQDPLEESQSGNGGFGYGSVGGDGSFQSHSILESRAGSLRPSRFSEYSDTSQDQDVTDAGATYQLLLRELPLALMRSALQRGGCSLGPALVFMDILFKSDCQAKHVACRLLVEWLKKRFETATWREQILCLDCIKSALVSTSADAFILQALSQMVRFFRSPSVRAQASMLYNQHTRMEADCFEDHEYAVDEPVPIPECPKGHNCTQGDGTMGLLKCTTCNLDIDPFTCYYCKECSYNTCVECIKKALQCDTHVPVSDPCPEGLTLTRSGKAYATVRNADEYTSSEVKNMTLCMDLKLTYEGVGELLAVEIHFEVEPVAGVVGDQGVERCYVLPLEVLSVPCLNGGSVVDLKLHLEQVEPVAVKLMPTVVFSINDNEVWCEKASRLPHLVFAATDILQPCPVPRADLVRVHSELHSAACADLFTSKTSLLSGAGTSFLLLLEPFLLPDSKDDYLISLSGGRHMFLHAESSDDGSATVTVQTDHWPSLPLIDEMVTDATQGG